MSDPGQLHAFRDRCPEKARIGLNSTMAKMTQSTIDFVLRFEQEYEPNVRKEGDVFEPLLCSSCFSDHGLRLVCEQVGIVMDAPCPNCGATNGIKLDRLAARLAIQQFFNRGSILRTEYGGAPVLVANSKQSSDVRLPHWSQGDLELITAKAGWGVFHYGPRLWMVGEVAPLKSLVAQETRSATIDRILNEYPVREIGPDTFFYRMRRNLANETCEAEFDSPPKEFCGGGRLDSKNCPVLYGSQDLQVCVHECRTTVDDETYMATLVPTKQLRLLNLTHLLAEEKPVIEFESLDLAVHMLFLARQHSYGISRQIAIAAKERGFDGIIYPSYFSLLRTGARPFDTILGMSVRRIEQLKGYAASQVIANLALFGWPVKEGTVKVASINKVIMERAVYDLTYGPVGFECINVTPDSTASSS